MRTPSPLAFFIRNIHLLPVLTSLSASTRTRSLAVRSLGTRLGDEEVPQEEGNQGFHRPVPEADVRRAAAIYLFTCESPLYKELNRRLRERNRQALKQGFFPYTRLLFEGYRAMVQQKPRMVNRGVKKDLVTADPDTYEVGESVSCRLCRTASSPSPVLPRRTDGAETDARALFGVCS